MGGAYKPKESPFYIAFARQLCDDTHLPGWLSAFPAHSQTFTPTPASFTHTNMPPHSKWKENSDWGAGGNCIPSGKYQV